MDYKKIVKDNYTLHLINTNRFKTISVVVFLTKEFNKRDIKYGNLLCKNLVYTSKKYNTKNKMATIGEELYGATVSASFDITGASESFVFSLDFLNPIYTEKKYIKESIDFFTEVLFNPNIEENKFQSEYFNIIKKEAISRIKSIKDNPNQYASMEYAKIMFNGTPTSYPAIPTVEDIEALTEEELYDFYKKLFDGNFKIDIAVHGTINDEIIPIIEEKFKNIKESKNKIGFKISHKYDKDVIEKVDSLSFNQSKLYMGYRLNDLTKYELDYVLRVYNTILGTMNDSILFNVVREENSLCYSIGSFYNKYNPALTIYAGINKSNYEKTVKLIKECVESMKDKKTLERLFDSAKKTINTFLNNYYDDLSSQINRYYTREFEEIDDIETIREKIKDVTIEEIIELNKKIELSTIYLLKGDN